MLRCSFSGFPLTAPDAFTLFSLFTALQFTVGVLPHSLRATAEAKVAIARLQGYLQLPEHVSPNERQEGDDEKGIGITIKNATMGWTVAKNGNGNDKGIAHSGRVK